MKLQIRRLLPGLRVLNARPIDKYIQNEKDKRSDKDDDTSVKKPELKKEKKDGKLKMDTQMDLFSQGSDGELDHADDIDMEKELKHKKRKMDKFTQEKKEISSLDDKRDHGKLNPTGDTAKDKKSSKQKRAKTDSEPSSLHTKVEKQKKKTKKGGEGQVDVIDDTEAPFEQLFGGDSVEDMDSGHGKVTEKAVEDTNSVANLVSFAANRKESKKSHSRSARLQLPPVVEIGMGGASTWDDE